MTLTETFLQNGSGFFLPTLLADFLTLVILVCLITMLVFKPLKNMVEFRSMAKQIGGPKGHWFWGDVKLYGFTHDGLMNSLKRMRDFPAICTYYIGFFGIMFVYHPDVVKTLLSRSVPKSMAYKKFLYPVLRKGLVTSDGGIWKRHRRLLTAVFHFDILKEYCQVFNKNCNFLLEGFDEIATAKIAGDVAPAFNKTTFANMMECVMSQQANDDKSRYSQFIQDVKDASFLLLERQQNILYWNDAVYRRTKSSKTLNDAAKRLFAEVDRIIQERRILLQNKNELNGVSEISEIKDETTGKTFTFRKRKGKTMDFLDLLLQTKDQEGIGLTNDEIRDEVMTFFGAGAETVATASTWISYVMATNPEEQTKCREEITKVCGDKQDLTLSDLSKLTYVTQCIKESLRLFPPVHALGRQLVEDTVLSHRFNDYKEIRLKKGVNVGISIFALHRNPYVWENPESFLPDRFSPENASKIPPFAFIPFGAGPRVCIGQQFGMAQIKVFFANVLKRFELLWDPSVPAPVMNPGVTNAPKFGLPLIVKSLKT